MKTKRTVTVTHHGDVYRQRTGRESEKSAIRLAGKWLRDAGFQPGYQVTVSVSHGEIKITMEDQSR